MEKVVIFGAGGLGREALLTIQDMHDAGTSISCVGFAIDQDREGPSTVGGIPVYRGLSDFTGDPSIRFVVALGDSALRKRKALQIEQSVGSRFSSLIHPKAWVGRSVVVGHGTIIMGQSSITTDVAIGNHVLINPQASIAHDCIVEDFVSIGPGVSLAGSVLVGEGCDLGTGATVTPRRRLGAWSVVGAGAVVVDAVPEHVTVVGVPARIVSRRST